MLTYQENKAVLLKNTQIEKELQRKWWKLKYESLKDDYCKGFLICG